MPFQIQGLQESSEDVTELGHSALQQRALRRQMLSKDPDELDNLGIVERDRFLTVTTLACLGHRQGNHEA